LLAARRRPGLEPGRHKQLRVLLHRAALYRDDLQPDFSQVAAVDAVRRPQPGWNLVAGGRGM